MTATAKKIRQSELMARFNMTPKEIKDFREKHLSRDLSWWKEGPVIYWTEEAAKWLEIKLSNPFPTIETDFGTVSLVGGLPQSDIINIRIVKPCNNPRFVIGDLNGFKVYVACPRTVSKNLVGKNVNVRVSEEGGETKYTYEP